MKGITTEELKSTLLRGIEQLANECDDLKRRLNEADVRLETANAEKAQLTQKQKKQDDRIVELQSRCARSDEQLKKNKEKVKELKEQLKDEIRRTGALAREVGWADGIIFEQKLIIDERENQLATKTKEVERLTKIAQEEKENATKYASATPSCQASEERVPGVPLATPPLSQTTAPPVSSDKRPTPIERYVAVDAGSSTPDSNVGRGVLRAEQAGSSGTGEAVSPQAKPRLGPNSVSQDAALPGDNVKENLPFLVEARACFQRMKDRDSAKPLKHARSGQTFSARDEALLPVGSKRTTWTPSAKDPVVRPNSAASSDVFAAPRGVKRPTQTSMARASPRLLKRSGAQ